MTPHAASLAVVSGHVEDSVDLDRWAVSLALDQLKTGGAIQGLAEDAANWYPGSLAGAAALVDTPWLMPVQKDVFHVLECATQTLGDVERVALGKLAAAEQKAIRQGRLWRIRDFDDYEEAHQAADAALHTAQDLHFNVGRLHDALALVDLRSGEIRDPDTARWYLAGILASLARLDDPRVAKLLRYIGDQQGRLFTFLDWVAVALAPWRARAAANFGDSELVQLFERAVAHAWHVRHAVETGQYRLRRAADHAEANVIDLCQRPLRHPPGRRTGGHPRPDRPRQLRERVHQQPARASPGRSQELPGPRLGAEPPEPVHPLARTTPLRPGTAPGPKPFEIAGVRVFDPDGNPTDDWLASLRYPKAT